MVSKRPPLLGYNHNVRHAGRLFHVQTEDSGLGRPVLTTHIFIDGTILSTARTQYVADEPDAVVQKKMQDQHKSMLKRVRDGEFDNLPEVLARTPSHAGDAHSKGHETPAAKPVVPATAKPEPPKPAPVGVKPALTTTAPAPTRVEAPAAKATSPAATVTQAPAKVTPLSEERTAEIVRPGVAAKPSPPPPPAGQSLADRLKRPATPVAQPVAQQKTDAKPAAKVVEFVADDDDDLEPAVTIEAAEPSAAEDVMLSSETPLPQARPLGSLRDSISSDDGETMRFKASQMPVVTPAVVAAVAPSAAPPPGRVPASAARPQTTRAIPSALPRPRPTSEGVIVARYPLAPSRRAPLDPLRATAVYARPTTPAPLALAVPIGVGADDGGIDATVLAFLGREQRR